MRGRQVELQVRDNGTWKTLAKDRESRQGRVSWQVDTKLSGRHLFRLRATATTTLPTYVSPTTAVQIATLRRVSRGADAAYHPTISDDGGIIAYSTESSDGSRFSDIRLWRGTTGKVEVAVSGDGDSANPALSGDGSQLFFDSVASLDGAHAARDIFVHPVDGIGFARLTTGNGPSGYPRTTTDGRFVVFVSWATDLVPGTVQHQQVYQLDRQSGVITRITNGDANSDFPVVSDDGGRVVFTSTAADLLTTPDSDGLSDVYSSSGGTTDGLAAGDGNSFWTAISGDGTTVAFHSDAGDLVSGDTNATRDVFVARTGSLTRLSAAWSGAAQPALSGDGSFISYAAFTKNGSPRLVFQSLTSTRSYAALPANAQAPEVSLTGRYVAFTSGDGLVGSDTNGVSDVYLWDRGV